MSACPTFRDVPIHLALRGNIQECSNNNASQNIQARVTEGAHLGNPNRPEYAFCQHPGFKGFTVLQTRKGCLSPI